MKNPIKIEDHVTEIKKAEEALNYTFKDKNILLKALTHPSAVQGNSLDYSYERFEFLGDSILEAAVSIAIFNKYPDLDEGKLTRMRVAMVSGENLSKIASNLGLDECIIFGASEENTGKRGMKRALENVIEALIAAVFIDGREIEC